ncbi:MAG: S4 domain-containing protein [Candidatus Hodarchaeales archaeon]
MMRLDEWIVHQGVFISRSKAKRYIQENGVKINGNLITKVAYKVKDSDIITIDPQIKARYEKPIGYQKLAYLISQANITIKQSDVCLDIGASVGGYSQLILEHNVQELIAIEFSSQFITDLDSIKAKYSNFSYIIGDFFKLYVDLPTNYFSLILIDLTIDPHFLLENLSIIQHLASHENSSTRILLSLKLGKVQDKNELVRKFKHQIKTIFQNLRKIKVLKSLPKKQELVLFIKLAN